MALITTGKLDAASAVSLDDFQLDRWFNEFIAKVSETCYTLQTPDDGKFLYESTRTADNLMHLQLMINCKEAEFISLCLISVWKVGPRQTCFNVQSIPVTFPEDELDQFTLSSVTITRQCHSIKHLTANWTHNHNWRHECLNWALRKKHLVCL